MKLSHTRHCKSKIQGIKISLDVLNVSRYKVNIRITCGEAYPGQGSRVQSRSTANKPAGQRQYCLIFVPFLYSYSVKGFSDVVRSYLLFPSLISCLLFGIFFLIKTYREFYGRENNAYEQKIHEYRRVKCDVLGKA